MDLQNIQDQLNTEFAKDSTNYIFWFDDKAEYEDEVSELQLGDVKLHILDGKNWLYSKYLLNEEDTESKYLIYAPFQDRVMQKSTCRYVLLFDSLLHRPGIADIAGDGNR